MNGVNKYLLDTNAVIALLAGSLKLNAVLCEAMWVGISVITKIEYFSFPELSTQDEELFRTFEERVVVVDLMVGNQELFNGIVALRRKYGLKIPDAIVVASAIENHATLLTADKQLLSKCKKYCQPLP